MDRRARRAQLDRNIWTACARGMRPRARGSRAAAYKLTRDVFAIGGEMVRENPATLPIAASGMAGSVDYSRQLPSRRAYFRTVRGWHDIAVRSLKRTAARIAEVTA